MQDRSGSLGVCKWWRFCDVHPNPPGMTMEYRLLAGSPSLDPKPAGEDEESSDSPAVSFKLRRLVPPDQPQPGDNTATVGGKVYIVIDEQVLSPERRFDNPWVWQFEYDFDGGKGLIEVTTMVGEAGTLTETFLTGLPLNQS